MTLALALAMSAWVVWWGGLWVSSPVPPVGVRGPGAVPGLVVRRGGTSGADVWVLLAGLVLIGCAAGLAGGLSDAD